MKLLSRRTGCGLLMVAITLLPRLPVHAQNTNPPAVARPAPAPVPTPAAVQSRLPYGVGDVVSLSRARVSEDVIVNYIRNSGTSYSLGPSDIVYLRDQGVADQVINSMINQRKQVVQDYNQQAAQQAALQSAQSAAAAQQAQAAAMMAGSPPNGMMPMPYPMACEIPVEEEIPPSSSLYVIPDPAVRAAYYSGGAHGITYYGVGFPVYYGLGGSMVYHFGRHSGGSGRGSHGSFVHVVPRR